ncbi:MAG: hypothetical protein ACEPOZ_08875 [Marinifilaceae bacterium]
MKTLNLSIFSAVKKFRDRLFICSSKHSDNSDVNTIGYQTTFYKTIEQVPIEIWDQIANKANIYFNRNFLRAMEESNTESIESSYLLLFKENSPIAIACLQIMDFSIQGIVHDCEASKCFIRSVGDKKILVKGGKPLRILICGNAFVSGEHGLFIKEEYRNKQTIQELAQSLVLLPQSHHLQKPVNAIVVKDFNTPSLSVMGHLKQFGYHEFMVEPNMVLHLHPSWNSFENYLSFMKTKFRTKAKSAFKKSKELEIKNLTSDEITSLHTQLTDLYRSVEKKAEFNLGVLNLESYAKLKQQFGPDFILRSYWLNNEMVGFLSALVNHGDLDAHFIGLNYKLNKQYAIYQRILYDYVNIGIERKLSKINFGRTASEIKSTLGATPEELTCYARHKNPVSNRLVKPIFNYLRPTSWEQRMPFKEAMMKTS